MIEFIEIRLLLFLCFLIKPKNVVYGHFKRSRTKKNNCHDFQKSFSKISHKDYTKNFNGLIKIMYIYN